MFVMRAIPISVLKSASKLLSDRLLKAIGEGFLKSISQVRIQEIPCFLFFVFFSFCVGNQLQVKLEFL